MRCCKRAVWIVLAALREIFDEASYARFLERSGRPSSRDAYDEFWRERELAHARRPRCC
jgi:hypothetical protein